MAPRSVPSTLPSDKASSIPGIWKYPTGRDDGFLTGEKYLAGRRLDDGAEGLWRIHDKLYDLSGFAKRHPGGEHWIRMTEGMDITELFEAHHLSPVPERMLPTLFMRDAREPRNSPYTFNEDGFYRTLKQRAVPVLARTPDRGYSRALADAEVAGSVVLAVASAALRSYWLATLAGFLVTLTAICAHNFTHQKNNWRQYYLSLSLLSLSEWRVSHILSHHMYPNTILDYEMTVHEPILRYLPRADKTFMQSLFSCLGFPFYILAGFFLQVSLRIRAMRPEDFLPLVYLASMLLFTSIPVVEAVLMWLYICAVSSFTFLAIGLTAAHHHPDIFHDGDAAREDRDWGLGQLDAVRDREDHGDSNVLALMLFGHHALHHLFPTVDHWRLPALYPVFNETLREFGVEYRLTNSWELVKGMFLQLWRNKPNPHPPSTVLACGDKKHF